MNEKQSQIVIEFAKRIRKRLGGRVREIILFGSHARGSARHDSDYDFVIVVDKRDKNLREAVIDIEADILDEYGYRGRWYGHG